MRFLTDDDRAKMVLVQEEPRGPSQLIEIPVTANGLSKITFPDIANLRNQSDQIIIIKAIRLITDDVLSNAPTIGGINAPYTELIKISLVLYCEGWEKAQLLPILTLNDMFTEGSGVPYRQLQTKFDSWRNLDWNKSFMQYSNGTVTAGSPYTVILDVEYVKMMKEKNDQGIETGRLIEIVGPA